MEITVGADSGVSGQEVPIILCVSADALMLDQVRQQLAGVCQLVSCADLVQLRAMLFPSPSAPTPAVWPVTEAQGLVEWGELVVDRAGHRVTWRGEPLPLAPTERELLALLIGPPLVVWSYEQLCASVLGGVDTAALQSTVRRLRRRLRGLPDGPQVHTVRGVGYRLDPAPRLNGR